MTIKFSQVREGDDISPLDLELWQYFAGLYRNANKGIKGRGKDRKISGPLKQSARYDVRTDSGSNSSNEGEQRKLYGGEDDSGSEY